MARSIRSYVKHWLVQPGVHPRTIRTGILRGVKMSLDLESESQVYLGLSERELGSWFRKYSKNIQTAVDVGCHEGIYSLYFLLKTSAKKVLAFEPDPEARKRLQKNLQLNNLTDNPVLKLDNRFVGKRSTAQTVALDDYAGEIKSPCLIKMDIEGAEADALRGALAVLKLPDVRWIIETHSIALEKECKAILEKAGYQCRIIPNAWWRFGFRELRPIEQNRWLVAER